MREIKWHKPDQLPFNVAKCKRKLRRSCALSKQSFFQGDLEQTPQLLALLQLFHPRSDDLQASCPDSKQRGEQEIYWALSRWNDWFLFLREKTNDKVVITCFYALKATVGFFEFKFFSCINNCSIPANQKPAHAKVKGESYCSSVFH